MRTGRTSWTGRDENDNIKMKVLTLSETISSIIIFFFICEGEDSICCMAGVSKTPFSIFSRHIVRRNGRPKIGIKWMRLETLSCYIFHFHTRRTAFTGWYVACVLSSSARAPPRSLLWQNDNRLFCFRLPFLVFESLTCPDDDSETHFILHCTTWNVNANENVRSDQLKFHHLLLFLFSLFSYFSSAHLNSISLFGCCHRRRRSADDDTTTM